LLFFSYFLSAFFYAFETEIKQKKAGIKQLRFLLEKIAQDIFIFKEKFFPFLQRNEKKNSNF